MKRKCPVCAGKGSTEKPDSTSLYPHKKQCSVCRSLGQVMMMRESLARRMATGSFSGIEHEGFHPTGSIDRASNLNVVIFPDKEFS